MPPHGKQKSKAHQAFLNEQKELTEYEIRQAIYHRLSAVYQHNLETHCQEDDLEMEENTFLNTLLNYKTRMDKPSTKSSSGFLDEEYKFVQTPGEVNLSRLAYLITAAIVG